MNSTANSALENITVNSEFDQARPHQMPFHRKPNFHLLRFVKHDQLQECIRKTVYINHNDRHLFQAVIQQLIDYVQKKDRLESKLLVKSVSVKKGEHQNGLYYDITRSFIKCNTLKECLLEEKIQIKPTKSTITQLLNAYFCNIHLNYIVFSGNNVFCGQKVWEKKYYFEFNYTSVGFLFDSYCKRPICYEDLCEYANYLPITFYQQPNIKSRFNFYMQVRSFAVNLLSIVLQREINFLRGQYNVGMYQEKKIKDILHKVNSQFQELLKTSIVQKQIQEVSNTLDVDLMTFFKAIILQKIKDSFQKFNSWKKVIEYFKVPLIANYRKDFQLQLHLGIKMQSQKTNLEEWVRKLWSQQEEYFKKIFICCGIRGDQSIDDLIIYLLYKYNLINQPLFSNGDELCNVKFIKLIIKFYSNIIESDYLIESVHPKQAQKEKIKRDEHLHNVAKKLSEKINQKFVNHKQKLLFSIKQGINLKQAHLKLWHFGPN